MEERVVYDISTEYIVATVVADVSLDTQDVSFSFDGGDNWEAAEWIGDPGTTRQARLLLTPAPGGNMPTVGMHTVLTKVVDVSETPIVKAGVLRIKTSV